MTWAVINNNKIITVLNNNKIITVVNNKKIIIAHQLGLTIGKGTTAH